MMQYRPILGAALLLGSAVVRADGPAGDTDEAALAQRVTNSHCAACHTFAAGEPHGQGPNLHGLFGRAAGGDTGFTYSDAFRQALGGKVWSVELLDAWLIDTQAVAPGSGMIYFQDDAQIRQLIVECVQTSCLE